MYPDDILVTGKTVEDHAHTLSCVFEKLDEAGLTLKQSKCRFGLQRISYFRHIIDKEGLHPAPKKIEAIAKAPSPKNVKELRAFLGLVNYYHKFLPNLSSVLSPLYQLLQQNIKWKWTTTHTETFEKVKELLQSSTLLVHFDPEKDLLITADASPYGLGAVLSN